MMFQMAFSLYETWHGSAIKSHVSEIAHLYNCWGLLAVVVTHIIITLNINWKWLNLYCDIVLTKFYVFRILFFDAMRFYIIVIIFNIWQCLVFFGVILDLPGRCLKDGHNQSCVWYFIVTYFYYRDHCVLLYVVTCV